MMAAMVGQAQSTTTFTRPGTLMVMEVVGEGVAVSEGKEKPLKVEDRLRAEVSFRAGRRSAITVEFSNGTLLRVGADSEVVVEEFWQQPHSQSGKMAEWKEEPSPSQTRLRLARGDVTLNIKPLKVARGSSFTIESTAGALRITQGELLVRVQMTELGIGLYTLELRDGSAEFEPVNGSVVRLPVGKRVAYALETDPRTGAVRVSEAPKEETGKK